LVYSLSEICRCIVAMAYSGLMGTLSLR
jgi:hypothetical protein